MAQPVRVERVTRRCALGTVLLCALALATEWVRLPVPDVSWLLHVAGRVSEGAVYGVDVADVAPPPIIWYSLPAVWLGHWTGLGAWRGLLLVMGVAGALVLLLVRAVTRRLPGWDRAGQRALLLAAALAIFVLPWGIFGEREHLTFVLVLPYVLLFAAREDSVGVPLWLALAAGVAAGMGFAIKPHYALTWAALALVATWRHGAAAVARRTEFVAASATSAASVLAVLLVEPGYVAYMRRFGALYLHYVRQDPVFVALAGESNSAIVVLVALLATAVLWRWVPAAARPTVRYLLVAAIAFHVVAVLQSKGWRYHYLPGLSLSFILLVVLWVTVRPPVASLAGRAYRAAALGTVVALLGKALLGNAGRLAGAESATFDPNFESLLSVVQRDGGGRPIAMLSANLASAFPLAAEANTGWALRYGGLPWLPALYPEQVRAGEVVRARPFAERAELERWFDESVVADLRRSTPGLIMFPTPRSGSTYTRLFDYLAYFQDVPGFAALLEDYQPIGRVGAYAVLQHRVVAGPAGADFSEPIVSRARERLPENGERAVLALLVAAALLLSGLEDRRRMRPGTAAR